MDFRLRLDGAQRLSASLTWSPILIRLAAVHIVVLNASRRHRLGHRPGALADDLRATVLNASRRH